MVFMFTTVLYTGIWKLKNTTDHADRNRYLSGRGSVTSTVKPRYSTFQGIGQNHALNQGFYYCQHVNNYESTSWDQNFHVLLVELC